MRKSTVLITGSSRGIGKSIAIAFAKKGYNVILNCNHSIQQMQTLIEEIQQDHPHVIGIQADVATEEGIHTLLSEGKKAFGTIDILINNASISYVGLFHEMSSNDIQTTLDTNLLSTIRCSHQVVPDMIYQKSGIIINISSIWGLCGASCEVMYSATKGAINAFTKALAKELAPSNIRVNAIACGVIDTQMNDWLSPSDQEVLIDSIPMMRLGQPHEVADLCLFLASEESTYITGQVVTIDGGYL